MVNNDGGFRGKSLCLATIEVITRSVRLWKHRSLGLTNEQLMIAIAEFRQYCAPIGAILPLLAEYGKFHNCQLLSTLFPFVLIWRRKLTISGRNSAQLIDLILDYGLLDQETLESVTELTIREKFTYRQEGFFSKFPNLQKFRIGDGLKNETIECLAMYCPNLIVFDASHDVHCQVTDTGLRLLSHLKKLRYVLLYPQSHYEVPRGEGGKDRRVKFTGSGIASLMTLLPELAKITCADAVMQDALKVLQVAGRRLPQLKFLNLKNIESCCDVLSSASEVCPQIESLTLYVEDKDVPVTAQYLQLFSNMKELHIRSIELDGFAFRLKDLGKQLLFLHIDDMNFRHRDLLVMSEQCPNLKFLVFGGSCSRATVTYNDCLTPSWPLLFPRLETLHYLWGNLHSLFYFMHQCSSLVTIIIAGHIDTPLALKYFRFEDRVWPNVETISLQVRSELVPGYLPEVHDADLPQNLVDALPSLKYLFMGIARDEEVLLKSARGNEVWLHSNHSFKLYFEDPEWDCLNFFNLSNS